jgi:hypothetical protein
MVGFTAKTKNEVGLTKVLVGFGPAEVAFSRDTRQTFKPAREVVGRRLPASSIVQPGFRNETP